VCQHHAGGGPIVTDSARILIVDDQQTNRDLLTNYAIGLGHEPHAVENGLLALAHVRKSPPDLIFLDIMMPEMGGHEVLDTLKADTDTAHIPVIVISALDGMDSISRCIRGGAEDYLLKPFDATLLEARINASLDRKRSHDREEGYRRQIEDYNLRLADKVREQVKEIVSSHQGAIFAMSKLAESRDPETGKHLERMREYCGALCVQLRNSPGHSETIDDAFIEDMHAASPLHDIGKVGVPDRILQKPGKLTGEEFGIMETHSTIGAETLREVDRKHPGNSFLCLGIQIAEAHHEKWDGSGYPHGLAGDAIPLAGRILALADVYDALTSKRCYKEAFSHEKSKGIILAGRGKHFDPDVVDAFVASEQEFLDVRERLQDTEEGPTSWIAQSFGRSGCVAPADE